MVYFSGSSQPFPSAFWGTGVSRLPGDGSFARKAHAAGAWTVLAALLERNLDDFFSLPFDGENSGGKTADDVLASKNHRLGQFFVTFFGNQKVTLNHLVVE